MWSKGTIGVPQKDGSYIACKYWVKHYEEGSEWGIVPEDETTQTALAILLKEYN